MPYVCFAKDIPDLKDSTARGWKTVYLREHRNKILEARGHGYGIPVGRLSSASQTELRQ